MIAMRLCGDGMDDARDPLAVRSLYASASPEEQRAIEVVAEQVGRQPIRRNGTLEWEPLLDPDVVTETMLARADRFDDRAAAALRDLIRSRNAYASLAASARQLVEASIGSVAA